MAESTNARLKVVVGDRNFLPHRELFEALLPVGVDTSWHTSFDEAALVADLSDADVYVGGTMTPAMARAGTGLRVILAGGAGIDKISVGDLPAHTRVANTFHHENSMAEYISSVVVTMRRGLLAQDAALRRGSWASAVYRDGLSQPSTLRGAMIGYVGFGHVGARTADLLGAFGARACAVTGSGRVADDSGLEWHGDTADLGRLMTESDVVVVSAPLTSSTTGMIDAAHLRRLGPSGVLVNVGRGPLVVELDLFEALRDRVIGGAAIDVWYRYPTAGDKAAPAGLPFAELPNVLMTPHISGVTRDTFVGRVRDITDNISRLHAGQEILRVVTPT